MTRFHDRVAFTLFAASLVLAATHLAAAQRGGRSFGQPMGGVWPAQLVLLEQVQSELELTDEQKAKAAEINEQLRSDRRKLFQKISKESGERQPHLAELNRRSTAQVKAMLNDVQSNRLRQIMLQVNGAASLSEAEVAEALGIKDDQKVRLEEIAAANAEVIQKALQELGSASAEERLEAMAKLRRKGDEKLLAVLTADQREQFTRMKGKKFERDLSQLVRSRDN